MLLNACGMIMYRIRRSEFRQVPVDLPLPFVPVHSQDACSDDLRHISTGIDTECQTGDQHTVLTGSQNAGHMINNCTVVGVPRIISI